MNFMNLAADIVLLQQDCIPLWKAQGVQYTQYDFLKLVEENHAFNYQLWLAEDEARREDKGFEYVYHSKRQIDFYNQQRNNRMEAIDKQLYDELRPSGSPECSVHSETPGMMIDRLSILALKHYHMHLQTLRTEVNEKHRTACSEKLNVIQHQLTQLQKCLEQFIQEIRQQTRTFKIYYQFKMYNDPQFSVGRTG